MKSHGTSMARSRSPPSRGWRAIAARCTVRLKTAFASSPITPFPPASNEIPWTFNAWSRSPPTRGMKDIVCPMYDQAYSALIEDLDQRGLLGDTMVANLSEFGRTPKVNPAGG